MDHAGRLAHGAFATAFVHSWINKTPMTDGPVRKLGDSAAANPSGQHNGGGEGRHVLTDIVDKLHDSSNGANVSIGEVVDEFEDRGFGALCTIIA